MKRKSFGRKDGGKKRRKSGDEVVVLIVIGVLRCVSSIAI